MKNKLLLFLITLTITNQINAQDKRGYIGISLGSSIPMGDLSSKDANNNAAGFANPGAVFDVTFAYKLGKGNFGITALLRGQANPSDAQSLADEIANQNPGILWTVETGNWGIGGLMVGGFGSFPISDKASFDTRAMIGFLSASSPQININAIGAGGTAWIRQYAASATSFSYLFGAGFKFDIGRKLYLLTNLDYLGSNPEFTNVETVTSLGERSSGTYSQSLGTLNVNVGLAFKL